jgi:hypothetical protein
MEILAISNVSTPRHVYQLCPLVNTIFHSGPTDLPRDPRVHIYDVYDNELSEARSSPPSTRSVFEDFNHGGSTTRALMQDTEEAFHQLEAEAEATLASFIKHTYSHGNPTSTNSFPFARQVVESLCKYMIFLRFRNSAKYREIVRSLEEPAGDSESFGEGVLGPVYLPLIIELRRRHILRAFITFMRHSSDDASAPRPRPERHLRLGASVDALQDAMDLYCWRLCGADVCIGVASDDQEFIQTEACFGTLAEGFDEDPYVPLFF